MPNPKGINQYGKGGKAPMASKSGTAKTKQAAGKPPTRSQEKQLLQAAAAKHGRTSPQYQALVQKSVQWDRDRTKAKVQAFARKQGSNTS